MLSLSSNPICGVVDDALDGARDEFDVRCIVALCRWLGGAGALDDDDDDAPVDVTDGAADGAASGAPVSRRRTRACDAALSASPPSSCQKVVRYERAQ